MDCNLYAVSFGHRCFDLLLFCISWCEMAIRFVCLLVRSFRWVYCGYSCYFRFFCWVDLMMVLLMWNPMWSHYMMYPYTWQSGYALFRFPMMTASYHTVACSTAFHYLPHANIVPSFSILSCLLLSWPTFLLSLFVFALSCLNGISRLYWLWGVPQWSDDTSRVGLVVLVVGTTVTQFRKVLWIDPFWLLSSFWLWVRPIPTA